MLEKFLAAKQAEISHLERQGPLPLFEGCRAAFAASLRDPQKISIIAEYKRASPSCGAIRKDMEVEEIASQYVDAGCSALSILTETEFFDGRLEYIDRAYKATGPKIPILRKDFIFHPLQIAATAATPASALLLIARMFNDARKLGYLMEYAASMGLEAVVEVFDANDLILARDAGAGIIQVNARDLDTLKVNKALPIDLITSFPPAANEVWIAASGMATRTDLMHARKAGYKAALIGTSLMKSPHPGSALKSLLSAEG